MADQINIIEEKHHRNGVGGIGFTAFTFDWHTDEGEILKGMRAIVFPSQDEDGYETTQCTGEIAVTSPGTVTECWRGDRLEHLFRERIVAAEREMMQEWAKA